MTEFTPLTSFVGGALIGLSAVLLMAFHGRIMGATGLLAGLFDSDRQARLVRAAVVVGMVSAPFAFWLAGFWPRIEQPVPPLAVALGGVIVGLGVSWGGGCTSGHGVCGLARLSRRSAVAVLCFMAAAFATVYVIRHGGL